MSRGRCDLKITGKTVEQIYICPGSDIELPELICSARQARGHKSCYRCSVRKGGKDDPRPVVKSAPK